MNKTIQSSLPLKLIALGLLFLIPITIDLGLSFFYPTANQQELKMQKSKKQPQELKNKRIENIKIKQFISIFLILLLILLINFITIPLVKCSIIGSILYLFIFKFSLYTYHAPIAIVISFICLLAIVYYAYQDQNLLEIKD